MKLMPRLALGLMPLAFCLLAFVSPPAPPPPDGSTLAHRVEGTLTPTRSIMTALPPKTTPTPQATEIKKPQYRYWLPWVSVP